MTPPRYNDKPLLRLLECYVLRTIGELHSEHNSALEKMTPKLQEIYQCSGEWYQIVKQVMRLPDSYEIEISRVWNENRISIQNSQEKLSPEEFAQIFVDQNFDPK